MSNVPADDWLARLAAETKQPTPTRAPSRLKSRIYSALMQAEAAQGPLASLTACEQSGHTLCFWEQFIQITPLPSAVKALNHCHLCHARVLGEHVEGAPLPWAGCPYAEFQK